MCSNNIVIFVALTEKLRLVSCGLRTMIAIIQSNVKTETFY
jgi:hypothetical protein